MRKKAYLPLILLIAFSLSVPSCKKEAPPVDSGTKSVEAVKGPNVRKNGSISVRVRNIEKSKAKIREFVDDAGGQILDEKTLVNADSSLEIRYKIKVKSEAFSSLIDKLSHLGAVLGITVQAEDVSDELASRSDRIDLLTTRLNEARHKNDAALIDRLQAKLNDARRERAGVKTSILYSYIFVTLVETTKIGHAFSLGVRYGLEGFVWMIKALLVLLLSCIPLLCAYLISKLVTALFKYRWSRLVAKVEKIGGRKE